MSGAGIVYDNITITWCFSCCIIFFKPSCWETDAAKICSLGRNCCKFLVWENGDLPLRYMVLKPVGLYFLLQIKLFAVGKITTSLLNDFSVAYVVCTNLLDDQVYVDVTNDLEYTGWYLLIECEKVDLYIHA